MANLVSSDLKERGWIRKRIVRIKETKKAFWNEWFTWFFISKPPKLPSDKAEFDFTFY